MAWLRIGGESPTRKKERPGSLLPDGVIIAKAIAAQHRKCTSPPCPPPPATGPVHGSDTAAASPRRGQQRARKALAARVINASAASAVQPNSPPPPQQTPCAQPCSAGVQGCMARVSLVPSPQVWREGVGPRKVPRKTFRHSQVFMRSRRVEYNTHRRAVHRQYSKQARTTALQRRSTRGAPAWRRWRGGGGVGGTRSSRRASVGARPYARARVRLEPSSRCGVSRSSGGPCTSSTTEGQASKQRRVSHARTSLCAAMPAGVQGRGGGPYGGGGGAASACAQWKKKSFFVECLITRSETASKLRHRARAGRPLQHNKPPGHG